ncbi:MAG: CPBP family glutamic-type intramembrane protease [Planctomycetota bacterium]
MSDTPEQPATPEPTSEPQTKLDKLDAFMAANPWHPRVVPYFVFIVGLAITGFIPGGDRVAALAYLPLYLLINVVILWLLWRYRKLTPELNLKFHWTVIPSAALLTVAWISLGFAWNWLFTGEVYMSEYRDTAGVVPSVPPVESAPFGELYLVAPALFWVTFVCRGLGMSITVALFEELFVRSALLRGFHRWKETKLGLMQVAADMPAVGDMVATKPKFIAAQKQPAAFTKQLAETPLGAVTVFATFASTLVFMLAHLPRDWAGCIACGIVWCWMVWYTNRASLPEEKRKGLGPVIWSHGLVNAALWVYTITSGDWQFL